LRRKLEERDKEERGKPRERRKVLKRRGRRIILITS
jgi:hypothetical protein